jgi:hypothetical protein
MAQHHALRRKVKNPSRLPAVVCVSALLACTFALAIALAGNASAATFQCPAAPQSWKPARGGPAYWGPEQNPGTDVERITCSYLNTKGEALGIAVNFALPTDLNPVSDFAYGCDGGGPVAWDANQRVYQVTSHAYWLDANFSDPYHLATGGTISAFESAARTMLSDATELAHPCLVKIVPTSTLAGWLFDFAFRLAGKGVVAIGAIGTHVPAAGIAPGVPSFPVPDAHFSTETSAGHTVVHKLDAPVIPITVRNGSGRHVVTVAITKAGGFSFAMLNAQTAAASLNLRIRVVASSLSSCPRGSRGTLSLATHPATVRLALCASTFGSLKTQAAMVTIQQS